MNVLKGVDDLDGQREGCLVAEWILAWNLKKDVLKARIILIESSHAVELSKVIYGALKIAANLKHSLEILADLISA